MKDIREDMLDRAKCEIDEQIDYSGSYDTDDAINQAIDNGLIYYRDMWAAIERYADINKIWDLVGMDVMEAIFDDIYRDVEDYADDKLADLEDDSDEND